MYRPKAANTNKGNKVHNDFLSSGSNARSPTCLSVNVVPPSKAIMDITEKDIIAAIIPRFVTPKSRL